MINKKDEKTVSFDMRYILLPLLLILTGCQPQLKTIDKGSFDETGDYQIYCIHDVQYIVFSIDAGGSGTLMRDKNDKLIPCQPQFSKS